MVIRYKSSGYVSYVWLRLVLYVQVMKDLSCLFCIGKLFRGCLHTLPGGIGSRVEFEGYGSHSDKCYPVGSF